MWEGIFAITRILTAIITGILGPFAIWWVKERYSDENSEDSKSINEEVKFSQDIRDELESIRKEVDGGRVWISQFHNGGKILNLSRKASMKRISVTHEVTAPGVSRERRKLNDILVSFFSEIIEKLLEKEHVCFKNKNNELQPEVEIIFQERGNEKMHLFAMKDIEGVLIGIMGIDFTTAGKELSEEEIQYLKVKANLLAGYVIHGQVQKQE